MNDCAQFYALTVLGYVADLLVASPRETFERTKLLVLLNAVKNDPDLFDPEIVVAYDAIDGATHRPSEAPDPHPAEPAAPKPGSPAPCSACLGRGCAVCSHTGLAEYMPLEAPSHPGRFWRLIGRLYLAWLRWRYGRHN